MRVQGVVSHQLRGNSLGESAVEPAADIDCRQFPPLALGVIP